MKDKRAVTPAMVWVFVIIGVLVAGVVTFTVTNFTVGRVSIIPVAEFDGEFQDVDLPEEVVGTDLSENATGYSVTSDVFSRLFLSTTQFNTTNGLTFDYAMNFEISGGGMTDFKADVKHASTLSTTEAVYKNAYIMLDEKGLTVDSDEAISTFEVDRDDDGDQITIEADEIAKGEYVLVVVLKNLAGSTVLDKERLFTVDFDADSEESDADDSGQVVVYNKVGN